MESNCLFCDVSKIQDRLIAEVDGFYVVATLGQITDGGYVLILPKRHVSCIGAMNETEVHGATTVLQEVNRAVAEEYSPPYGLMGPHLGLMFEHGIVGQTVKHAHIHVMPAYVDLTAKIKKDFPNEFSERKMLGSFTSLTELQMLYREKQKPYLFWQDSRTFFSTPIICWNPPAPPQYLRIVAAEALGRPERANWREMDPELDKRLGAETVRRLKPYF